MDEIQSSPPSCGHLQDLGSLSRRFEWSQAAALSVREEANADVSIVTAEGDRVTLSADSCREAARLTYAGLALSDAGFRLIAADMLNFRLEQDVAVLVEGDLNADELADIRTLLADLGSMLKEAVAHGNEDIDWVESGLQELTTLASVQADLEYHASVSYGEAGIARSGIGGAAAAPAEAEMAGMASAGTDPAAPAQQRSPKHSGRRAARIAERLTQRAGDSGPAPRRFFKLLQKLLRAAWKDMVSKEGIEADRAGKGDALLDAFFDRLRHLSEGGGPNESQKASEAAFIQPRALHAPPATAPARPHAIA